MKIISLGTGASTWYTGDHGGQLIVGQRVAGLTMCNAAPSIQRRTGRRSMVDTVQKCTPPMAPLIILLSPYGTNDAPNTGCPDIRLQKTVAC